MFRHTVSTIYNNNNNNNNVNTTNFATAKPHNHKQLTLLH